MEGKEGNRNPRSLIILRGLPGAGKSTLAEELAGDEDVLLSIDDFFTDPVSGSYAFDHRTNHLAYRHCEERVKKAMEADSPRIFCHNVFNRAEEMEPYFALAKQAGYRVFVVTVENYHGSGNRHGISAEQVEKMRDKYRLSL